MNPLKLELNQLIKTNDAIFDFLEKSALEGFWYLDTARPEQVWIGYRCLKTLDYAPEQLQTALRDWLHIISEEDLENLLANQPEGADFRISTDLQIRYKQQGGTIIWSRCDVAYLQSAPGQSRILVAIKEVSWRKVMDEKLRISEQSFKGAFDYAAIGMALVDPSGQWMRVNNSLCDMLGYSREELMNLTFQQITYPADLHKDLSLLRELIEGKRDAYQMEKRYFHKDGHLIYVILAVSAVKDHDNNPLHFISQITDITTRKAAEQEMKTVFDLANDQNKRLLNFAHIVSHNLRSHSGNLNMLLEFMREEDDEASRKELIGMVHNSAVNLHETIGHLNEVVIMHNTVAENLVPANLRQAVQNTLTNVRAFIKAANGRCINKIGEDVFVNVVPAYLDSILLNFLTNAIKYSAETRPPLIEFSAKTEGHFIELCIKDNGLGIDLRKNGDKLFGMYKTFHKNKDSRGIGLFITKNQIEVMGGKVRVESEVDAGTTFKIYLQDPHQLSS